MKGFKKTAAQGDVFFIRKDNLPEGLKPLSPVDGRLVVAHSETGHSHVMVIDREDDPNAVIFESDNPLIAWLQINRPTTLEHLRPFDTHEAITFEPGFYEVRRQREYDPYEKLARQVMD